MCWHDTIAAEQICKLRDEFSISTFIETGTFRGINTRFQSFNFEEVLSCDVNEEYLKLAFERTKDRPNVKLTKADSSDFLRQFVAMYYAKARKDFVFIYLDAHFYDPNLPKKEKWVILKELRALRNFAKCVICIHDFDCSGLGHLIYDDEHLDFNLIGSDLKEVNSNFHYYHNTKEGCSIVTKETLKDIKGVEPDSETLDSVGFIHSTEERIYRGILYCVPKELDLDKGGYALTEFVY